MTTSAINRALSSGPQPGARTLLVSRAILYATLVVGVLDATDGVVFLGLHGQNPIQVLQYIASSLTGRTVLLGRRCHSGSRPRAAFRHLAGSRIDLYPCEPTRRCVAYAVGAPGTAVWRCRVGGDEPAGLAAHCGRSRPDRDCGVGQRRHGPRSLRRLAQCVLREEGGGGMKGLAERYHLDSKGNPSEPTIEIRCCRPFLQARHRQRHSLRPTLRRPIIACMSTASGFSTEKPALRAPQPSCSFMASRRLRVSLTCSFPCSRRNII